MLFASNSLAFQQSGAANTGGMQYWETYYADTNKKAFIWLSFRRFFKLTVKKLSTEVAALMDSAV